MVVQAIQSVISMLILMLIGAWLAGKDWFRKSGGTGLLSKLIVNVLVPLYMLNNVLTKVGSRQKLWEIVVCLPLPMITIFISLGLGIWMAGRLGIHAPRRGVFINVMTFTNCVLVGFPIIISLFGEEAAAVGMVYYMVNTICFWTIGVQLLREDGGQKSSPFSKGGAEKAAQPPAAGLSAGRGAGDSGAFAAGGAGQPGQPAGRLRHPHGHDVRGLHPAGCRLVEAEDQP